MVYGTTVCVVTLVHVQKREDESVCGWKPQVGALRCFTANCSLLDGLYTFFVTDNAASARARESSDRLFSISINRAHFIDEG